MSTTTLTGKTPAETAHEAADNTAYSADPENLDMSGSVAAGTRFTALMRFTDLAIPRGANISSAILRVTAISAAQDDADLNMHCEDIDDCPSLATLASIFTERTGRLTTAGPAWVATGLGTSEVSSPTFESALQEVISRTGYSPANAIGVLFDGSSTAATFRIDGGSIFLDVTYNLLSAQNALSIINTGDGQVFTFDRRVSEVTVQCDTGSAQPVQFKVPGVVNDWFEIAAGKSISVFLPPKETLRRDLAEVIFRVSSGTGTASYVTSGA